MFQRVATYCFFALLIALNTQAFAGGVFIYEISAQEVGLASAGWTARAKDPSTAFTNPAGMSLLPTKQLQMGLEPLYAYVDFDYNDKTTVTGSDGNAGGWIPSAGLFYVTPLTDRLTFGFGSLGVFGSALDYNSDWVGRYYVDYALLQGFSASATLAYRLTDRLSIGGGYTFMYGIFKDRARINDPNQEEEGRLKLKDDRIGNGYLLGVLYQFTPCTRIGVQYLSGLKLNFSDVPSIKDISPQLQVILDEIGLTKNPVNININIPQSVMVGFYHDLNCRFSVMGNIGWQQWSKFGAIQILLGREETTSLTLATKYKNGWHIALGSEFYYRSDLTFLFGMAYDTSILSNAQRTFSFPVGEQWRFGLGALWKMSCKMEIDFAYELNWSGDLPADQDRGPLAGRVAGTYRNLHVHFVNLGLKKWF